MSAQTTSQSLSSDALRSKALKDGLKTAVKVNQRMLIDKMLARYSSDFVVCRELIQNADDATATTFHFEIFCTPNVSDQTNFHNSTITEIRAVNNGLIFTEVDWNRVASIAEGNTNVESVGQFGVGFFSVFSFSEEPSIASGKEYITFVWQEDDSLTTFRLQLPVEQQSDLTSVILRMRGKYILDTEMTLTEKNTQLDPKSTNDENGTSASKTEIIPTINLSQLKAYFTKVLSFSKHITELVIKINGSSVFQVHKKKKIIPPTNETSAFKLDSLSKMLRLGSFIRTKQKFSIKNGPSITLIHISVEATLNIDEDFHNHIRRILKKSFPATVQIQLLFAPNHIITKQQLNLSEDLDLNTQILNLLIPLKYNENEIIPEGLVFIGLGTRQTTGIGMHTFSHFIPTIERENLDLQDPHIAKWNKELLASVGQIARFVYDQTIHTSIENNDTLSATLALYSFQRSFPNNEIGAAILNGFFSSKQDLLVPVKVKPSVSQSSLMASSKAYLAYSKPIHSFLSLPLIPFEIVKNDLFNALQEHALIAQVSRDLIKRTIAQCTLESVELIELLHWLCSNEFQNNKQYIKSILSTITFRDAETSKVIILRDIEYYETFNISLLLPLLGNALPATIATHVSSDDLNNHLSLKALSLDSSLHFYFDQSQKQKLTDQNTVVCLLNLISRHWTQIDKKKWQTMSTTLSTIACIPTTQGMKVPKESYIRSPILSSELAIITLDVVQSMAQDDDTANINSTSTRNLDNRVLVEVLKFIGCRTINIQSFVDNKKKRSGSSLSSTQNLQMLVQHLLDEWKNMSNEDIESLKHGQCFPGTTRRSTEESDRRFCASELHFPWVATQLKSNTLLIIDWHDLDPKSDACECLKIVGVREAPALDALVDMIVQEHENSRKEQSDKYRIPHALRFLAENVEKHYPELWKTNTYKRAFLPSRWPTNPTSPSADNDKNGIVLMPVDSVFISSNLVQGGDSGLRNSEAFRQKSLSAGVHNINPLCASPLFRVVQLFENHLNLSLLGVETEPTLAMAFTILMDRKDEILTSKEWTRSVFIYMKNLEGLSVPLKEKIATLAFIPLEGSNHLVKPSQVFIHRDETEEIDTYAEIELELLFPSYMRKNKKIDTGGLIDYVDFGSDGNSFLLNVGVCHSPSASVLAELLLNRQASFFNDSTRGSGDKVVAYIRCLQRLEDSIEAAKIKKEEMINQPLEERLKNEPWCLGYYYTDEPNSPKTFKIALAKEIYRIDDQNIASRFHPLCCPTSHKLYGLYKRFGSKWLLDCVQVKYTCNGAPRQTNRGNALQELILFRLDILFVDRRGLTTSSADEKSLELLRRSLIVCEVDDIQCHWTLQEKTITSNETCSCTIIYDGNRAALCIKKDQTEIRYIDVATKIAGFVIYKPTEEQIFSILYKLTATLDELKRFGIPVDHLLAILQQKSHGSDTLEVVVEQKVQMSNVNMNSGDGVGAAQLSAPKQSGASNIGDDQTTASATNAGATGGDIDSTFKNLEKYVNTNHRVPDFRTDNPVKNDDQVNETINQVKPYDQSTLVQPPNAVGTADGSCEAPPGANMKRYKDRFHNIPLYVEEGVPVTQAMCNQARQLATIIAGIATQIYNIPVEVMHMYRDIDGARISFNHGRSIFINLRYFEQIFSEKFDSEAANLATPTSIIQNIVNFYYINICHLLVHNKHSNHDATFIRRLEEIVIKYLPAKDQYLVLISHC